jgi:hypothetical protein
LPNGFVSNVLRGLTTNVANKLQIEYSLGMFVSRQ